MRLPAPATGAIAALMLTLNPGNVAADSAAADRIANQVIAHFQFSTNDKGERVRYPGERVLKCREENMRLGIPVDPSVWEQVQAT